MRRMMALLLMLCLLCGVTACGGEKAAQTQETDASDTSQGLDDSRWGVDITGGAELTFCPSDRTIIPTAEQLEAVKAIIEKRLVSKEITDYEASIDRVAGEVIVRFPLKDEDMVVANVAKQLAQIPTLQFRMGDGKDAAGNPTGALILDGTGIAQAEVVYGQIRADGEGEYYISLEMTETATVAFAQATEQQAAVQGCISIWLDYGEGWQENGNTARYEFVSAPTVNQKITDGEALVTSDGGTYEEAKELADALNAGTLPFSISLESVEITSPSLGSDTTTTLGSHIK